MSLNQTKKNFNRRGCPRTLDRSLIREKILDNANILIDKCTGSIISKSHIIWKNIIKSFPKDSCVPKHPRGLYSFVMNNVENSRHDLMKLASKTSRKSMTETGVQVKLLKTRKATGGRRRHLDYLLIKTKILENAGRVMSEHRRSIVPKTNLIWNEILNSFPEGSHVPKNAGALYSFVVNDVAGIRNELKNAARNKLNISARDAEFSSHGSSNCSISSGIILPSTKESSLNDTDGLQFHKNGVEHLEQPHRGQSDLTNNSGDPVVLKDPNEKPMNNMASPRSSSGAKPNVLHVNEDMVKLQSPLMTLKLRSQDPSIITYPNIVEQGSTQKPTHKITCELSNCLHQIFRVAASEYPSTKNLAKKIYAEESIISVTDYYNKENLPMLNKRRKTDEGGKSHNSKSIVDEILKNITSWTLQCQCNKGCLKKKTSQTVIKINIEDMHPSNFIKVFEKCIFPSEQKKCYNCPQSGVEHVISNVVGDVVIFEPFRSDGISVEQQLRTLPQQFRHPIDGFCMKLVGIIETYHSESHPCNTNNSTNYFAICYKRDGSWTKYSPQENNEDVIEINYEPNILFMLYMKI